MVKLESGGSQTEIVEFLAGHDIAVCAHLGLRPQSVHKTGGFRVQGREQRSRARHARGSAGAGGRRRGMVLLECIPAELGKAITAGAARAGHRHRRRPDTDGQILVLYDMLDITTGRKPRFVRNFMAGSASPLEAAEALRAGGEAGEYPAPEHCF